MINKQVFISVLFMNNNWPCPKSLVILTTVTHGSNHRSENKERITEPFWQCHMILRPSNQNYSEVKYFAAPNQSVGVPEMGILLHFTSSSHVNMEGWHCCCLHAAVICSPRSLSTRAAWVKGVTDRSVSVPANTVIIYFSCLTEERWLQCNWKVVASLALMFSEHRASCCARSFSPLSTRIRLINYPVSCVAPDAVQNEWGSIPDH